MKRIVLNLPQIEILEMRHVTRNTGGIICYVTPGGQVAILCHDGGMWGFKYFHQMTEGHASMKFSGPPFRQAVENALRADRYVLHLATQDELGEFLKDPLGAVNQAARAGDDCE